MTQSLDGQDSETEPPSVVVPDPIPQMVTNSIDGAEVSCFCKEGSINGCLGVHAVSSLDGCESCCFKSAWIDILKKAEEGIELLV